MPSEKKYFTSYYHLGIYIRNIGSTRKQRNVNASLDLHQTQDKQACTTSRANTTSCASLAGGLQLTQQCPRESPQAPQGHNMHNNEGSKAKIVAADGPDQRGAVNGGPGRGRQMTGKGGGQASCSQEQLDRRRRRRRRECFLLLN